MYDIFSYIPEEKQNKRKSEINYKTHIKLKQVRKRKKDLNGPYRKNFSFFSVQRNFEMRDKTRLWHLSASFLTEKVRNVLNLNYVMQSSNKKMSMDLYFAELL